MKNRIIIFLFLWWASLVCIAQPSTQKADTVIYKKVAEDELIMKVVYPPSFSTAKRYPAMIFFFGGGWTKGSIVQFEMQANHFAQRGMVCFLTDYRVKSRQGTSIIECVKDARSAVRFVRENADRFRIDAQQIVACGASAGGHIAATTAIDGAPNETTDNLSVSAVANALVLFNPILNLGPGTLTYEKQGLEKTYELISPFHNIEKETPPTLILLGTNDKYIAVDSAEAYRQKMEEAGNRCELALYQNQTHGFFNFKRSPEYYQKTLKEVDGFLTSLQLLMVEKN